MGRHTPVEYAKAIQDVLVGEAPTLLTTSVMVVLCMTAWTGGESIIPHNNKDERTKIGDIKEQHLILRSKMDIKIIKSI